MKKIDKCVEPSLFAQDSYSVILADLPNFFIALINERFRFRNQVRSVDLLAFAG